jgi:cobalamin biosynthesis Mg chelatase CobN
MGKLKNLQRPLQDGDMFTVLSSGEVCMADKVHAGRGIVFDKELNCYALNMVQAVEIVEEADMDVLTFILVSDVDGERFERTILSLEMRADSTDDELGNMFGPTSSMLDTFANTLGVNPEDVTRGYFFKTGGGEQNLYSLRFHYADKVPDDHFFKIYKTALWRI